MTEEAAGYAELAERLGRVRLVRNGTTALAVVDGDEGSSPARMGLTALAAYDAAGYYDCSGGDPDEDCAPVIVDNYGNEIGRKATAEAHLCRAAWERPDLHTSGECIEALERRVTALENLCAGMAMHLSAERSEIDGLRQNVAGLEHRVSEMQRERDAQEG